jgi:predicted ATPase
VLFIVEDGHWIDPSSAELLDLVVEQIKACCVLVLVTHRPEWQPSFSSRSHVATLQLSRLGRRQGEDLIRSIAGRLIADEVLSEIVQRTDGVPLFIEEVTKSLVETGLDLAKVNIPATLHASLLARIDRLGPDAKAVAQVGAVIGRQFPYSLVSSATDLAEDLIKNALDRLVRSELVFRGGAPPDAIYTFKHALVQDAAYQSLLKSSRQQHHARIARVFEEVFPGTTENEPELLAHHFTEAGLAEPAVDNWLKAGRRAMQRSANVEAEQHLRSGLALLKIMPIGAERRRREIALQNTLGVCLMPTRGFGNAEIREAFTTAAMISEEEGDTRGLFVALRGKGQYQMISGDLPTAREQAGRILELAKTANDAGFLIEAHHLAWSALTFAGDLDAARRHAEAGIALYDREQHHGLTYIYSGHDPGVCCRSFGALATWQLGFPDRGLAQSLDGLALARELTHPFSVTIALWGIGILYLLRRDSRATHETGQMLLDYSVEKGIPPFVPMGKIYRGGALAEEGMFTEGLRELREGIAGVRKLGTEYTVPTYLAWLAELCAKSGLVAEGLQALEEGLTMAQKNQDFFSLPEFHRIRGELLLMESANSIAKVEACLEEGIGMARRLGAKSLELRAVTRLAQLWGECGKRTEARHLLAPVYGWFTEGVGTLDLKNAKALLHELA